MYQERKDELLNKYRNMMLMDRYEKAKRGDGMVTIPQMVKTGKTLYDGIKGVMSGKYPNYGSMNQPQVNTPQINTPKVNTPSINPQVQTPTPQIAQSAPTLNTASSIPSSTPSIATSSPIGSAIDANVMGNASNAGTSAVGNAIGQQVGSSATQGASSAAGGASQALGAAGGALSVGLDAKNMMDNGINFNNGTDMAADAASLGLMATGVGAPVAAAIQAAKFIKNMVTGAIQKKKQKAMAKSEKAAAEATAENEASMDEDRQQMEKQRQQNLQDMQQSQQAMAQTSEQSQSPIAEAIQQQVSPTLGGLQNPEIMKQNIMDEYTNYTPQAPVQEEQGNGMSNVLNALGTVASVLPNNNTQTPQLEQGQITGGAAPVMPTDYKAENAPALGYEGSAQQGIDEASANETTKRSLMDKFRSGLQDFGAGYQDNANSTLSTGDLAKNLQGQSTSAPAPTQSPDGTFVAQAVNNKPKTFMNKLGEAAGTGQRIMAHPLTQAAIAGGISKLAGGDINDIAKAAYQYGTQKAAADRYYQQTTGNTNRPFINTYTADDYKTRVQTDLANEKMQQSQNQFDAKQEFEKMKLAWQMQKAIDDRNALIQRANIMAAARKNSFDPTQVPGYYEALDELPYLEDVDEDSEEYKEDLDSVLYDMYGDNNEGFWGKYSDEQIKNAKERLNNSIKKQKYDIYKKYRINPAKRKKN